VKLTAILLGSTLMAGCTLTRPEGSVKAGSNVPLEAVAGTWEGDVWWEIFGAPSWRGTAALELRPGEDGAFIEDIRIVGGISAGLIRGTTDFATDILPRYELGASGPWILAGNFIFVDRDDSEEFTAFRINAVTADSLQLGIYLNSDPPRYEPYVLRLRRRADSPPPTAVPPEATLAPGNPELRPEAYFGVWRLANDPPDSSDSSSSPAEDSAASSSEIAPEASLWAHHGPCHLRMLVSRTRTDQIRHAYPGRAPSFGKNVEPNGKSRLKTFPPAQ